MMTTATNERYANAPGSAPRMGDGVRFRPQRDTLTWATAEDQATLRLGRLMLEGHEDPWGALSAEERQLCLNRRRREEVRALERQMQAKAASQPKPVTTKRSRHRLP